MTPIPSVVAPLVLGGLLLASVVTNIAQWRTAKTAAALCTSTLNEARTAGKADALEEALEQTDNMAEISKQDREAAALAETKRLAAEAEASRLRRRKMDAIPDPVCAPGQEIQDAINAAARGES